jgi:HlyD family secretion protein
MRKALILPVVFALVVMGCGKETERSFYATALVEGTAIQVAAQTGGYIVKVLFDEGEMVQMGQTIAVVDTQKIRYQLDQVLAGLQELRVQRRIAETNAQRAQDTYDYAKTKYERYRDLYRNNAASEQLLDDLKVAYDRAQTELQSSRQTLETVSSKEEGVEAQIKFVSKQIEDAEVKAPLSGTITSRYYDAGETIPTNAPLVEIIDLSRMWAKVYVSETFLPKIRIGQPAHIQIDGSEQMFTGRVDWISAQAEFTPKNILTKETRTTLVYAVKITVDNPEGILKHGMPVAITLDFAS